MAIVELQMRRQAFADLFKNEINRQRLPSRTLKGISELDGKLLQRIECAAVSIENSAGAGRVTVNADIIFHHNTLAAVRAAGSLQLPVTEKVQRTIPITLAVVFDQAGRASVQWSVLGGAIPGRNIPVSLPGEFSAVVGAVEANETIVAIRFGTRADDPVFDPIFDRLGPSQWVQFVSGQVIADVFARNFDDAIQDALSDKLVLDTAASGAWFPAFGNSGPFAGASATVIAVDECIFDIDVPVDLQLIGTLAPAGPSLVTTIELSWEPDSTECEIVGGLLFTPIASVVINGIASDKASEKILGTAQPFQGFQEIGRNDESITYQRTSVIDTPSPRFVLNRAEVTDDGFLTGGTLSLLSANRNLVGSVSVPTSGLKTDCHRRTVFVEFRRAKASFEDLGVEGGAPRLLPDGVSFDPPNAWVVVPGPSNTWLDLSLTFVDPPTGRLPVGTATSVFLHTDCGLRWLDLGVIPADHAPPTFVDMAEMLSHCMAISDPWGMGMMNLEWLIDPPDFLGVVDPVREWTIAARELPVDARLEFAAVGRDGSERSLGAVEGQRAVAVHIVTDATETLKIRTNRGMTAPAPLVSQRWVVPFAAIPLRDEPVALASVGRVIGVREANGATRVVDLGLDGQLRVRSVDHKVRAEAGMSGVLNALSRAERRNRSTWAVPARIDRQTVALAHGGKLLIGTALPPVRL
ncbi:MAG: hypothetical protein ACREOG_12305 [Gemmatimonadaceae bacterium]